MNELNKKLRIYEEERKGLEKGVVSYESEGNSKYSELKKNRKSIDSKHNGTKGHRNSSHKV